MKTYKYQWQDLDILDEIFGYPIDELIVNV